MELMERITETMHRYIVELGTEGKLIKILLKEITKGLGKEEELLLRDYSRNWEFTKTAIPTLTLDDIIEPVNLMRMLLYSTISDPVVPYGYRILSKTSLGDEAIESLISHFKSMPEIANAIEKPDLVSDVIGEKDTKKLLKDLNSLKEQSLMGKKI
jgi:diadenylate cyclase